MLLLGIRAFGYGNRKKNIYKNWIENKHDLFRFKTITGVRYLEGYEFDLNDENFKYYYISYLYLLYDVCAHSYSSVGNFNSIVSIDQYNYIDFSLEPLYFDVL